MNVDFLTLACLRDHLDGLLGARVQNVVFPDERSLSLELYAGQRVHLLASADPSQPCMLLTPQKPRRGVEDETPLLLLLRKWVRGGRLVDVSQPPWERILTLHFESHIGSSRLVVELVGRYSNVILVGPDDIVLDAVKHVGPDMTRYRVTLPGQPYQLPPPPPNRRPPTSLNLDAWVRLLSDAAPDEPLERRLVRQLLGVGPLLAREAAARATGDPAARVGDAEPEALALAVRALFSPLEDGHWAPHVAVEKPSEEDEKEGISDETARVIAFAAYELRQYDADTNVQIEPVPDISQAMWRYFEDRGLEDAYAAARQAVQALIDDARERLERGLEKLQEQMVDQERVDELRTNGELLLTYQAQVPPRAREVTLTDYEGQPRTIPLDPKQTPVENAQAYFKRYDKAQRAAKQIPRLMRANKTDLAYLSQLDADLDLAESRPEIDAVRDALSAAGWAKKRRGSPGPVAGPRRFEVDGFPIYVGRNANQNEQVTFKRAGPQDLWLHVVGLPGAHVIVKCGHQEAPQHVVQRASQLAAYYSPARKSQGRIGVHVTERRFVHRLRGAHAHPGLVTYREERTVWVQDVEEALDV